MKLYIKNMVCGRCKTIVKAELDRIGAHYQSVELGEAVLEKELTPADQITLNTNLQQSGLELISRDKSDLIENLKKVIIDLEHFSDEDLNIGYCDFISDRLKHSFTSLDTMFSEIEGITIEKYIINHKIELVKELLIFNKLNINEIARKMHYSNAAKLSSQFKNITGLAPLRFRQLWLSNNHCSGSN